MNTRHIIHFISVSLKYFFNFDLTHFLSASIYVPFLCLSLKLYLRSLLQEGLLTVKNDAAEIKDAFITYTSGNKTFKALAAHISMLRDNISDRMTSAGN